jgi:phosphonate transport system substrate-binding protein
MLPMTRKTLVLSLGLAAAACDTSRFRQAEVALASPAAPAVETPAPGARPTLRFSVAAVESPRDTHATYSKLFQRMGERLGMEIEFVQRRTYREVNDLLAAGELDAALVCTGGYLDLKARAPEAIEVVAAPLLDGKPTYESLVIVPGDSDARSLAELRGRRFAFTDELSFSGRAYVVKLLSETGDVPDRFFGRVLYTRNHDRSIRAVASGIVDGAAVHGNVFDHLVRREPELAERIRVVHRSPAFGAMPVVASTRLAPELRERLRRVLLELGADPEGAAVLAALDIDGFTVPAPRLYDSAARVVELGR